MYWLVCDKALRALCLVFAAYFARRNEISEHLIRRLITLVNLLCQRLYRDAINFRRYERIDCRGRRRINVNHLPGDLQHTRPGKRRSARDAFVKQRAEREEI